MSRFVPAIVIPAFAARQMSAQPAQRRDEKLTAGDEAREGLAAANRELHRASDKAMVAATKQKLPACQA